MMMARPSSSLLQVLSAMFRYRFAVLLARLIRVIFLSAPLLLLSPLYDHYSGLPSSHRRSSSRAFRTLITDLLQSQVYLRVCARCAAGLLRAGIGVLLGRAVTRVNRRCR
jgi:hypothetical protein